MSEDDAAERDDDAAGGSAADDQGAVAAATTDEADPEDGTGESDDADAADATAEFDPAELPDVDADAIDHDADVQTIVQEAADAHADVGPAVAALVERIDALESEVDHLDHELETAETQLKRKQADFQNYKKRAKREQERIKEYATEELVGRLVEVRDNLQRAVDDASGDDVESLREGVRMTLSEFDRVLDGEDVERIEPEPGESVDPEIHEVLTRVESDETDGAIVDVHRVGYRMGERIVRPAQVTVSDGEGG